MDSASSSEHTIIRLQWRVVLAGLLVLGAFIGYTQYREYRQTMAEERSRLLAHARIIDDNLSRQLEGANNALRSVIAELPVWQRQPHGMVEASRHLLSLTDSHPGVGFMMLTDAAGTVLASSLPEVIGKNFSYRHYFQRAQQGNNRETLYISAPFVTTSKNFVINLTRVITAADGTFGGVVVASIDPNFFAILLGSVLYAPDMWSALAHGDGDLFLMVPRRESLSGVNLAKPGSFFTRHRESGALETVLTGTVLTTGEERLMAQRTISPAKLRMDKPLVVAVSRDLAALYASWRKELLVVCGLYGVVSVLLLSGLYFFQKRQRYYLDELVLAKAEAERANRSKSAFLATMSHEIRTPMNGMMGLLQVLERSSLSARQREYVRTAQQAARSLLTILNDILDISKVEAGKVELESIPFSPGRLFRDLADMLEPLRDNRDIQLHVSLDRRIPDYLCGDPHRLQQVLLNLAGNAFKFTEQGAITVAAEIESIGDHEATLTFSVRDTGVGIDPEAQKSIFDNFSQADAATTRRFGGTGLGLAISRQLVNLMGGELAVTSEPGKGSDFHFTVSFPVAPDLPWAAPEETPAAEAGSSGQLQRLTGLRLLVVEDNPLNQMVAQELLTGEGADVEVASGGQQGVALAAATEPSFDAVLMDIQMPGMNGYEATRRIREFPRLAGLPIIAMTAHTLPEEREAIMAAGMTDHVAKPVELDTLVGVLLRHCEKGSRTHSAVSRTVEPQDTNDVAAAVNRLGNNRQMYVHLARLFPEDQAGCIEEVRQALQDGRPEDAKARLHTLRGVAMTLGLDRLSARIVALEQLLTADGGYDEADGAAALEALAQAFDEACRLLAQVADSLEPPMAS